MYAVCSRQQAAESGLFYQHILTAFVSDSITDNVREQRGVFRRAPRSV